MNDSDPRHGTTAGHTAHKRAREVPCEPCRLAINEANKQRRSGKRAMRRCATRGCERRTESVDGTCRKCKAELKWSDEPESADALTGGDWVPRDGIMRWEAVA